jgi:hypothetical protein
MSSAVRRDEQQQQPAAVVDTDSTEVAPLLLPELSRAEERRHQHERRRCPRRAALMGALLLTTLLSVAWLSAETPGAPPMNFPIDGAGFHESTPAQAGLDADVLVPALTALSAHGDVGRVMVTRWGSHVQLPNGVAGSSERNISRPAPIWSISKSLVALSAALLLRNGSLALNETLPLSNDPVRKQFSFTRSFCLS